VNFGLEGRDMKKCNRNPRFDMRIPVRIRSLNSGISPSLATESLNVSATGLLFTTNAKFEHGATVEVLLRMPEEIVGAPANEWRCTGQVVRIEERETPTARFEVGVKFYCYEVVAQASAAATGRKRIVGGWLGTDLTGR
jgi:hypothetical protein